jgi:ATP-dependent 26S proteasome regulatory subunit
MNKKNLLFILIAALFISLCAGGWYMYTQILNPKHREIQEEKAININAEELYQSFLSDEKAANAAYLEKVIEISGKVGSVGKNADSSQVIFIQTSDPVFGVNCTMEVKAENLKLGDSVRLKGICSGFINDVVLIRCHVIE